VTWQECVDTVLGAEAPVRREWVIGLCAMGLEEWRVRQRTALCAWRGEAPGAARPVRCHKVAGAVAADGQAVCVTHWALWYMLHIDERMRPWLENEEEESD
jgi:hypothetical protein